MIPKTSLPAIGLLAASAHAIVGSTNNSILSDISVISQYWGQISPYSDNPENYFGVKDVGLPNGCQVEQVHSLQRHADRFPSSYFDDGVNDENFAAKVKNWTMANPSKPFSGPLDFLNSYEYIMTDGLLTGLGAATEFNSGVAFWNRYGRTLYNASVGQVAYNPLYANGTARPKPLLRTTSQSRIENSEINWALGFFGPSFQATPNPTLKNFTNGDLFDVLVIPEGGTENNTLASYDSCFNDGELDIGYLGDLDLETYIPKYLVNATARMQAHSPAGFKWTANDTYAMQSICAYEQGFIGSSDFCYLFTEDEWSGFESTLDQEYYYDYGFGNPTGRAQGIGYLQELMARLKNEYITSSNSSVNSSITNNPTDFPLGRPFYADFSHDDIIVSVLTAMSLEYFEEPPLLSQYPPDPKRRFNIAKMTPFGSRLVTEVIGCSEANATAVHKHRTQYYPTQYGYNPDKAIHKFIRMRLNNAILPLDTISGNYCSGRSDGLCSVDDFLVSQREAYALSNYDYVCFGNYSVGNVTYGRDFGGTLFANSTSPFNPSGV